MQPTETAEQTKSSATITESLTQPSQTPEESPIKLKVERDIFVQSFEKAKEFMRTQKKQIQTLEEEKQTILSDRQRLREEVRKSTVEIQRLTTELSESQKLNQSLHMEIWIAAGNEKLKKMLSELWSGLSMGVKMTEAEYAKKSLKEHEGIVESMKKCDTMEAAMKMHQHIERSLEDVLTEFEK